MGRGVFKEQGVRQEYNINVNHEKKDARRGMNSTDSQHFSLAGSCKYGDEILNGFLRFSPLAHPVCLVL
jgi:hypothetical protein